MNINKFIDNPDLKQIFVLALYEVRSSNNDARQRAFDNARRRATDWINAGNGGLLSQLSHHGWRVAAASQFPVITIDASQADSHFENEIRRILGENRNAGNKLVLVILAGDRQDVYSSLKRVGDLQVGISTSCVQSNKIRNVKPQYTSDVILKMNLRLGGRDHDFTSHLSGEGLQMDSMLVMGADVLHQGTSTGSGALSISCVVGSSEPTFTKYTANMRAQVAGQEVRGCCCSRFILY